MIITQLDNKLVKDVPLQIGDIIYYYKPLFGRPHYGQPIVYILGLGDYTKSAQLRLNKQTIDEMIFLDVVYLNTYKKDFFHLRKDQEFPSMFSILIRTE